MKNAESCEVKHFVFKGMTFNFAFLQYLKKCAYVSSSWYFLNTAEALMGDPRFSSCMEDTNGPSDPNYMSVVARCYAFAGRPRYIHFFPNGSQMAWLGLFLSTAIGQRPRNYLSCCCCGCCCCSSFGSFPL